MGEIADLIQEYGWLFYVITFAITFLEGETIVIFAGALAVPGLGGFENPPIDIYYLILVAWLGSFLGDQLYFLLGRKFGWRLLRRFPRFSGTVQLAIDLLHKYHEVFILTYRYMYGVRNFASLAMGMSELSWLRFACLNFVAAFIWANSFAWGGYLLGYFIGEALGEINFIWLMVGVLVFVLVVIGGIHWRQQKKFKARVARTVQAHQNDPDSVLRPRDQQQP